jgi:hypothetical protein
MPDELQSWWQNATPQTQAALIDGGLGLAALLVGHLLGVFARRFLDARDFNSLFRVARSSQDYQAERSFSPSTLAGYLVRLTAWAGAAWWLARRQEWPEVANTLALALGRTWAVVGVLTGALAFASLLTRRVMECLGPQQVEAPVSARHVPPPPRSNVAGAVGAAVFSLVMLLVLLTAADYFEWPLTRTAAAGLWHLAENLLTAGAALLIGGLGARWARDTEAQWNASSSEDRTSKYLSLGVLVGTTAAAVGLLLFGAGLRVGVALVVVGAVVLYVSRGRLFDLVAGLQLRKDKVGTVWFEGTPCQVGEVGLVQSEVSCRGEYFRVPNRQILDAAKRGAPAADNRAVLTR